MARVSMPPPPVLGIEPGRPLQGSMARYPMLPPPMLAREPEDSFQTFMARGSMPPPPVPTIKPAGLEDSEVSEDLKDPEDTEESEDPEESEEVDESASPVGPFIGHFSSLKQAQDYITMNNRLWAPKPEKDNVPDENTPQGMARIKRDVKRIYKALTNVKGIRDTSVAGSKPVSRITNGTYTQQMYEARAWEVVVSPLAAFAAFDLTSYDAVSCVSPP